jgi:hypothetical protein
VEAEADHVLHGEITIIFDHPCGLAVISINNDVPMSLRQRL